MRNPRITLFIAGAALVALSGTAIAQTGPFQYYAVTPCRVVDTRNANGPQGGPILTGGTGRDFPLAGLCGVPTTAQAAAINVTVAATTGSGHLTIWPFGITMPTVSTINFLYNDPAIANGAIVPLAAYNPSTPGDPTTNKSMSVFLQIGAAYSAHVVIDINGYFE
jgi:hypothetical protein